MNDRLRLRSDPRTVLACIVTLASASIAQAALSVHLDPESLASRSPVVVRGTVSEVASGVDPAIGRLATYVTVEVDAVLRGPDDLDRVVLREPGGRWGDVVHDVDAVPRYEPGEDVLVFLEPSPDGALRTTGMFFGKFTVEPVSDSGRSTSVRDLDGRGRILGHAPVPRRERLATADLEAVVRTTRYRPGAAGSRSVRALARRGERRTSVSPPLPAWSAVPPEVGRVVWSEADAIGSGGVATAAAESGEAPRRLAAGTPGGEATRPRFAPLSSSAPARWYEIDAGGAVVVDVERARDPLGDPAKATETIVDAMNAWNAVPESRLRLSIGDDDASFTSTHASSPSSSYPAASIVLFGDPYEDISDPIGCAGVLAIGGYWRSGTTGAPVNGTTYHRALRAYVIFNDGFECFLGQAANLAEVATHELGHAVGFGHSAVPDAVMRSSAYGSGRGARLGDDDRDAAHCIYPHSLRLLEPVGGESIEASTLYAVQWSSTTDGGALPGTVDLQYSADGGSTWIDVRTAERNDGLHDWDVPGSTGDRYRFRVLRPNRVSPTPSPWPSACSASASASDFRVVAPAPVAGSVGDGSEGGAPLIVDRPDPATLRLTWGPSCAAGATDFVVYAGSLAQLRSGVWSHAPATCTTAGALSADVPTPASSVYFLVAPRTSDSEGRLGSDSSGVDRPVSPSACLPRESDSACD